MVVNNSMQVEKDLANRTLTVTRHFNSPLEDVWRAWTESELLDKWWAPKPYRAETKAMSFKVGGQWLYAMVGPDNSRQWCKVDYKAIDKHKSYQAVDAFCDEHGNKNPDFPSMRWSNSFHATATGTKVIVEITFATVADMEKILAMGLEEGFTMAVGNLDELLAKQK